MTSYWAWWRFKSPASPLFTQPFIQENIKENIKAQRHWPFCGEFTSDRWIPRKNGQWRGKCFHLMTSSCKRVDSDHTSILFVDMANDNTTLTLIFLQHSHITKIHSLYINGFLAGIASVRYWGNGFINKTHIVGFVVLGHIFQYCISLYVCPSLAMIMVESLLIDSMTES